ncbi:hypothetical protein HUT16_05470 [Kitasatospora sp. NA04385]|uniref:hypothetical protein n=1 Tax=Kitasatospora sp. NA04385 TaxID=2742135 RepID=UPI001592088B|nr:hypothetical protein [Kitasatospora sp. NA04385]QKW18586.1 hypothetical protein HUT16_05470 [Kitasatospora sp. NA04385]
MDIVHASLRRKDAPEQPHDGEAEEVQAALWAHATPTDALQHITVRCTPEQVDLLLYLLSRPATAEPAPRGPALPGPPRTTAKDSPTVAYDLITRSHRASPMLRRRYRPPIPPLHTGSPLRTP